MGNKNTNKNSNFNQNDKFLKDIETNIEDLYKKDKRNILEINKTFKPKKENKLRNSNLKENFESNDNIDYCLYIISNLFTKSINHEINTSLYNPLLIPQIFENDINSEDLIKDNNFIIDMIYKTHLNKNEGKYNNWIPEKKEKSLLDELENFSSIHALSEGNLSSYDIEGKVIHTRQEENKEIFNNNNKIDEKNNKKDKDKYRKY
jgi:hypothetical protein